MANPAEAENALINRLVDEYKILQEKIDRIGAFRFTIKGWSITVLIAAIFAGSTTKVPRLLWAVSLIVFLFLFFYYEKQQTDLRYRLGQRVLAIEEVLSRLLRNLAHASKSDSVLSSFIALHFVPGIGRLGAPGGKRKGARGFWRPWLDADFVFYIIQVVVVLAVFYFWPRTPPQDHTKEQSIIINNALPTSTAEHMVQPVAGSSQKTEAQEADSNEKQSGGQSKQRESH